MIFDSDAIRRCILQDVASGSVARKVSTTCGAYQSTCLGGTRLFAVRSDTRYGSPVRSFCHSGSWLRLADYAFAEGLARVARVERVEFLGRPWPGWTLA
jgi:hypothetical protein